MIYETGTSVSFFSPFSIMRRLHSGPCCAAPPSSRRYPSFGGEFPREKRPTTQLWVPHHHPAEGDPCLPPPPEPGMPRTPASHPCHPLGAWDRLHKPSGDGCIPRRGAGSLLGAHGAAWGTPKALPSSWHCGSPRQQRVKDRGCHSRSPPAPSPVQVSILASWGCRGQPGLHRYRLGARQHPLNS